MENKIVGNTYKLKGHTPNTVVQIIALGKYCECKIISVTQISQSGKKSKFTPGQIVKIYRKCICNTPIIIPA